MTKEEHIKYWIDSAQYDWSGAEESFIAKRYVHCLFWAHLVLEKLAKELFDNVREVRKCLIEML